MPSLSSRARWSSARGQSTAFVASMLFVLVIFVSVVANVGQAVNRRIALQTIADTGAYTGASVMAVGFNQLAYWNEWMQWAWAAFTQPPIVGPMWQAFIVHVVSYPVYTCGTADAWEGAYNGVMTGLHATYGAINIGYALLATSEATRVSKYNAADLFPTDYTRLRYREWDPSEGVLRGHPFGQIAPSEPVPDGTQAKALGWLGYLTINSRSRNWYACANPGPFGIPIPQFRNRSYKVWFRKDRDRDKSSRLVTLQEGNPAIQSFVWVVTAPATKGFMFDRWFGGNVIPEMKAVAVAKPIGGEIEAGENKYVAKFMPVATVMAGNRLFGALLPPFLQGWIAGQAGGVLDSGYDRRVRIVTH
jgi:hypothetical protein